MHNNYLLKNTIQASQERLDPRLTESQHINQPEALTWREDELHTLMYTLHAIDA